MTQYMHFFRDSDPAAAHLAAALRLLAPNKILDGTWPMIPYLLTSVDDVVPFDMAQLEDCPVKARHFESLGQFIMRSGWKPDSTYCLFTAGARLTQHKHHDENNFVIYKKGFLALDTGQDAMSIMTVLWIAKLPYQAKIWTVFRIYEFGFHWRKVLQNTYFQT